MSGLFNEEATVVFKRNRQTEPQKKPAGDAVYLDLGGAEKTLEGLNLYESPLLNAATDLLSILVTIPRQGVPRNVERFRQQILEGINAFKQKGLYLDYHPSVIDKSCFVLCAAFDEAVLYTSWGQKARWENYSLLSKVFSQRNGGEAFFVLLEKAKGQPAKLVDFLELQYVLLMLGFKGRYREAEENHLHELKADVHSVIRYYRSEASLVQPVTPKLNEARQPLRRMHLGKAMVVMASVVLLGYAGSEYWYMNRSEPFVEQVSKLDELMLSRVGSSRDVVYISTDSDIGVQSEVQPEEETSTAPVVSKTNWELMLAAFGKREDALSLQSELKRSGYEAVLESNDTGFEVVLMVGDDLNIARKLKNEINIRFSLNADVRRAKK